MPRPLLAILTVVGLVPGAIAAADPATVAAVDNHHGWGWQAYVLGNGLVTVAVVPAIGGRVMQYDLGKHPFLWVNPQEVGKTSTPEEDAPWRNFGGYQTWVAPQFLWRRGNGGWPPAPHLDGGAYSAEIDQADTRNAVLTVASPVETFTAWQAAGLRFARRFTLVPGSTRLHVEQTVINTGKAPAVVSVWDVSQVVGAHDGASDYDRFWVYFPINHASAFGADGTMTYPGSAAGAEDSQWKHFRADGVGAVQYLHRGARLGADSDGGWMCYVDERDGYAYAKRFAYVPGGGQQNYPEGGNSIAVSTSGDLPYLRMEVMSPLIDLAAEGSYTFAEDWYAARIDGPVLAVNDAGVVKRHLKLTRGEKTLHLDGLFGVFYEGTLAVTALDTAGKRTALGSYFVSPTQPLALDAEVPMPPVGTVRLLAEVLDGEGKVAGTLDAVALTAP